MGEHIARSWDHKLSIDGVLNVLDSRYAGWETLNYRIPQLWVHINSEGDVKNYFKLYQQLNVWVDDTVTDEWYEEARWETNTGFFIAYTFKKLCDLNTVRQAKGGFVIAHKVKGDYVQEPERNFSTLSEINNIDNGAL